MRIRAFCLLVIVTAFCSGCVQPAGVDSKANGVLKNSRERISFGDRNGDGKVDLEVHRYDGAADAEWALRDDNYDGRYEKQLRYGIGISESTVDLPIATNVRIEANP